MSLKYKYFYAPVPKAAHSTMKLLLSQLEVRGLPVGLGDLKVNASLLYSPFVHPYQLSDELIEQVVESPEFYRFAVVRDPYDRIISCYIDKVLRGSPERKIISKALGRNETDPISLVEFLRAIKSQGNTLMDMHWKPQTAILLWDRIEYDFIGRVETMVRDVDTIFERITGKRAAEVVKIQSIRHHATDAVQTAQTYLQDHEAKELIQEIYADDFSAFSYPSR